MATPLVVKNGRLQQEQAGEEGLYPRVGVQGGRLVAGNPGLLTLQWLGGHITQVAPSPGGVLWDIGSPSVWDAGATSWGTDWDVLLEAVWDAGSSSWS